MSCFLRPSATLQELPYKLSAKLFASRGFRGLTKKKWRTQNVCNHVLKHRARSRDSSVAIIGLAEKAIGDRVNHHVARDRCRTP